MEHSVTIDVGGRELVLTTGKMARQANGAVFAQYGGTCVLATACCGSDVKEDLDFIPLSVDYNEKYYAAGKIPGGFFKREGRPREKEILVSRLIDRPMRPLFSKAFKREIQIIPTTVSADQINTPDVVAIVAASAAVTVSDIPFDGPVGAVRVGLVDGTFVINPTLEQLEASALDIVVAGTLEGITMVEGGAKEVSEDTLVEAIEIARGAIVSLCKAQLELSERAGKKKLPLQEEESFPLKDEVIAYARPRLEEACFVKGKLERAKAIKKTREEVRTYFGERIPDEQERAFNAVIEELEREIVRSSILERGIRTDGRGPEDIRPITCEVGVLPRTHGSALFTRGETQALAITTLGTVFDEQIMDDLEGDKRENFMLHYNFPPFSVGEVGRLYTGRREIGHGHLAHRALEAVLPSKDDFPYTLRVVSEILESNGSSSMATVCGSTLSLLNAGVPIKKPVAGIAMGLVTDGERTVILSDILGEEDHFGDMDFKVAGTEEGITAFQMDIKIKNIDPATMRKALEQARRGRLHILGIMNQAISEPRPELSQYAPRIIKFAVDPEKIGLIIGSAGKTIRQISETFDVTINIDDDGSIVIYSKQKEKAEQAKAYIDKMLEEPEVGKVYTGKVKRIVDFGAFIEFLPGREGLCHISQMSVDRIGSPHDVVKLNQEVPVRILEIDRLGRVNLTMLIDESMAKEKAQSYSRRPPRTRRR
ncbi:Polyribonucleotide nucleotidyltransferase [Spirochaeta thermophila DSM 6578]|uniref:Polyribonucleotide nucleotidyltransferase n=1 Tax=Winmispira thermophila (strain ATCC 700085 / DSM 6578 / Z-1203) TaxID=869211 RepID=G0GE61_WINT7|nr:polyribonucleotide nucleotidyltransferase [Spirochaeta thermophila]AEJ61414.1 Polyribonucleotide nucleotidyltransferase [Spirochaeta thermophila DSM 6578]